MAILLTGEMRNLNLCGPSIYKYFNFSDTEVDYFVHTWNQTGSWRSACEDKVIPSDSIREVYARYFNIIESEIGDQSYYNSAADHFNGLSAIFTQALGTKSISQLTDKSRGNFARFFNQSYSLYRANLLKIKHEKKLGFKYDIVARVRPDLFFDSPPDKKNVFYLDLERRINSSQDHKGISSEEIESISSHFHNKTLFEDLGYSQEALNHLWLGSMGLPNKSNNLGLTNVSDLLFLGSSYAMDELAQTSITKVVRSFYESYSSSIAKGGGTVNHFDMNRERDLPYGGGNSMWGYILSAISLRVYLIEPQIKHSHYSITSGVIFNEIEHLIKEPTVDKLNKYRVKFFNYWHGIKTRDEILKDPASYIRFLERAWTHPNAND